MSRFLPKSLVLVLSLAVPSSSAFAAAPQSTIGINTDSPKPLQIEPSAPADANGNKKPVDPHALPQMFIDERHAIRDSFNALLKEQAAIDAECKAATTAAEHTICDNKKRAWQVRMDAVVNRTRNLQRNIDFYRRKQAGLPPPPWWPQQQQKNGANGNAPYNAAPAPKTPQQPSTLVPPSSDTSSSTLPAGTF
jgi:hypothetical protein